MMKDKLLKQNIIQTFEKFKHGHQTIPFFAFHPNFSIENSKITSSQRDIFGFFAFVVIIRGVLQGLNYQLAGNLLNKKNFLSPSVNLYYTSSLHFLLSFLALNGRVFIFRIIGEPIIYKEQGIKTVKASKIINPPEAIIAILTKDNQWIFEKRTRSHRQRWKELIQIFCGKGHAIPYYFDKFFDYLWPYPQDNIQDKELMELLNYTPPPQRTRTNTCKDIEICLKRLVDFRHEAIYSSFGADERIHEALINKDTFSAKGIDNKSEAYKCFSISLLEDLLERVIDLLTDININDQIRSETLGHIFFNPVCFDDVINKNDLPERVSFLLKWWYGKIK